VSYKRGLAVVFGCAIAALVSFGATYPRFFSPAAPAAAPGIGPAPKAAAPALPVELPGLPESSPLAWARLSDAQFFWDQDLKVKLADRLPALKDMVFHARLGSLYDKTRRIEALAGELAKSIPGCDAAQAKQAAHLAKADLVSGVVGEFPELQGVMGRYCALHEKLPAPVAQAIAEHYSPLGPNDRCPSAPVSVAAALADKIDTLAGFFTIGEKPTGSKDPFALRRAALGVIRLIVENRLRLKLRGAFDEALKAHGAQVKDKAALIAELLDFFADRLKVALKEKGVRHDLIAAVFAIGGQDDVVDLLARVEALGAFLGGDDGAHLLVAYRRAANIVRIEEKKDNRQHAGAPDRALLQAAEEKTLVERLDAAKAGADKAIAAEDYPGAMSALAALRRPVDAFFDKVTVNVAGEPKLRENRLKLLSRIQATMDQVAVFGKIEG